ncbi:MAG TPA: helix-turn-helix transcriptional regulator [Allosphingosinicella sp.]|jgi:transcriptional regulator with XRE-family HTH domain
MSYEPQTFSAPDGTEMVILPASEYARLKALVEEGEDVADAKTVLARIEAGEGTMPGEVLDLILDDGLHPVAAWRRYRGLSQAGLARKAGLSQVWISRIERGGGYGSRTTRQRLAEALEAPAWALEEEAEPKEAAMRASNKGRKYRPLRERLEASGRNVVTLRFDEVAALVGGLPQSADKHREWWANHSGNSQAKGWMDAGYEAEPDAARRLVTFRRRD